MFCSLRLRICSVWVLSAIWLSHVSADEPRLLAPGYRLQLVASAPQIVTPVAIAFDDKSRLLVVESHTHQTPEDYPGPQHDRVQCLIDNDNDGRADRVETFFDGLTHTMSMVAGADGWIYIATRAQILRVRDADGDGRAEQSETLVNLETSGDYPHNGLAGLTFRSDGRLFFGLGENLGESYRLVGRDKSVFAGGGEGGSIFQCTADGKEVSRFATGFWNPFGNTFDPFDRLFCVDNDPDASPPCRLIHIVETGDYGYQFRYGRSGRHPLQAWDGELPGTLPMAAGTGEAPCQVLPYRGRLWVTSWGDYRLEAYELHATGATFQARSEVIVQGNEKFRPVGLAIAPDGSLIFSDWVNRSYPVHGEGRLWRLTPADASDDYRFPMRSKQETRAAAVRRDPSKEAFDEDDPFIRQAAVAGYADLIRQAGKKPPHAKRGANESVRERLGIMQAWRWVFPDLMGELIRGSLRDPSDELRLFALRLVAEDNVQALGENVHDLLQDPQLSDRVIPAALATLGWLESGTDSRDSTQLHARLAKYLANPKSSDILRKMALRRLPADHEAMQLETLKRVFDAHPVLRKEITQVLYDHPSPDAVELLIEIAESNQFTPSTRADAIAGLAQHLPASRDTLELLSKHKEPMIAIEAQRCLTTPGPSDRQPDIPYILARQGNIAAGERTFYRAHAGRCATCHQYHDRGGEIGPDLTLIHLRGDKRWLLETILDPNRDVAPKYANVIIETRDGRTITGLPLAGPGNDGFETLVQSDGTPITLPLTEIDRRHPTTQSVMPTGLGTLLSDDELADLLAFLSAKN